MRRGLRKEFILKSITVEILKLRGILIFALGVLN